MLATLQIQNIHFARDEQLLLHDVNFSVRSGEVLQIAGSNGSGKTTLLRMLCGLLAPTKGNILWCDTAISDCGDEYLSELIYCGHQAAVKSDLTVLENLVLFSALTTTKIPLNKIPPNPPFSKVGNSIEQVLTEIGLINYQYDLVHTLSAGQKRRLALAKLLLFTTTLWILDEPFTALDQDGVAVMEMLIAQHVAQGGMVVLTSHQAFELKNIKQQKIWIASPSQARGRNDEQVVTLLDTL